MLKKISAQKARQNFGGMMDEVRLKGDRFIVERGNRPMVAVIPVEEYATWEKIQEHLRTKIGQMRERSQDTDPELLEKEIDAAIGAVRSA